MKNNYILVVVLILISILLVGSASAAIINNDITTQKKVTTVTPLNSIAVPLTATINNNNYLIDSGANKFYWLERGGIFSYTWKTYKTPAGSVIININYKTKSNTWNGTYVITKVSKNKLKIVYTSPEVKLYTGHPSEVWYTTSTLTPVQFYLKNVKTQIKNNGYFFL